METIETTENEIREEFRIDNETAALWYLRKLANLEAERNRVKKQAENLLASLAADAESLKRRFHSELENWARIEIEARGGRRKSLVTLQGTLKFRNVPSRLVIDDPAAALRACEAGKVSGCIELRKELRKAEYLSAAEEILYMAGDMVPGVTRLPEREAFTVTFASPEEN
jgi:hypothetical protein